MVGKSPKKGQGKSRARSRNFTKEEKVTFLAIAKENKDIELKNVKKEGLELKATAWKNIVDGFNANNVGRKCSEKELQELWKRLKKNAKSEHDQWKNQCRMTGGGPPPNDLSQEVKDCVEILGDTYDPIDNTYDDDVYETTMPDPKLAKPIEDSMAATKSEVISDDILTAMDELDASLSSEPGPSSSTRRDKPTGSVTPASSSDNSTPSLTMKSGSNVNRNRKRNYTESTDPPVEPHCVPTEMLDFARVEHEKKMKVFHYQEIIARLDLLKSKEMCKKLGISIPMDLEEEILNLESLN